MRYKLCKFCENRARDTPLRGVYMPDFGQIWVKISIWGVLHPCRCTDGVKKVPSSIQISLPSVQRVAPAGRKTSKLALSKLHRPTGRFALRAMLPVKKERNTNKQHFSVLIWHCSAGAEALARWDGKLYNIHSRLIMWIFCRFKFKWYRETCWKLTVLNNACNRCEHYVQLRKQLYVWI